MENSPGIDQLPRSSATDRDGLGGPALTMAVWWMKAGIITGVHKADAWLEPDFVSRAGNTQVTPKGATSVFPAFPLFLVSPNFPSSCFWWYECLPSEGNQKYRLCLAHPLIWIIQITTPEIFLELVAKDQHRKKIFCCPCSSIKCFYLASSWIALRGKIFWNYSSRRIYGDMVGKWTYLIGSNNNHSKRSCQ